MHVLNFTIINGKNDYSSQITNLTHVLNFTIINGRNDYCLQEYNIITW